MVLVLENGSEQNIKIKQGQQVTTKILGKSITPPAQLSSRQVEKKLQEQATVNVDNLERTKHVPIQAGLNIVFKVSRSVVLGSNEFKKVMLPVPIVRFQAVQGPTLHSLHKPVYAHGKVSWEGEVFVQQAKGSNLPIHLTPSLKVLMMPGGFRQVGMVESIQEAAKDKGRKGNRWCGEEPGNSFYMCRWDVVGVAWKIPCMFSANARTSPYERIGDT